MIDINICYLIDREFLSLTLKSIESIKTFFKSREHKLCFYIIGIDEFEVPVGINYIKSSCTYLPLLHQRVYIPEMLGVDKVIFLDSDTLAMTCISKLWDIDLGDNIIGAVQSSNVLTIRDSAKAWQFDFPPFDNETNLDALYFDAGMMVIDCKRWIDNKVPEQTLEIFKTYKHTKYSGHDEPGFCTVLRDKWLQLDERWNYIPNSVVNRDKWRLSYIMQWAGDGCDKPLHDHFHTYRGNKHDSSG